MFSILSRHGQGPLAPGADRPTPARFDHDNCLYSSLLLCLVFLLLFLCTPARRAGAEHPALAFERTIAASFVECAGGFRNGRQIWARCGYSPTWFDVHDDEEAAIQNGGIMTHNHPGACIPLAAPDVAFAAKFNLREIRAVGVIGSTMYAYSLARRGARWPDIDLGQIGYNPGLQKPNEPLCGWTDLAWKKAAQVYGLAYSVHIEQLSLK